MNNRRRSQPISQPSALRTTLTTLGLTLALALTSSVSHAADSRSKIRETDLLPRTSNKTTGKTALNLSASDKDAIGMAGLSRDDVGDPASFGMHAVWLGVAQTQSVLLRDDCTGTDPSYERCIKLNPQPAMTSFDEKDLAHLYIPANSSMSLLCQWVTPFWQYQFNNLTGVNQSNARITLIPYLTIANSVLSDPAAIDPSTGLPFGGEVTMTIAMTHLESRSLEAGERHLQRLNYSRVCIGGIISANNLVDQLGLPQYLADAFLQNDTKIRFHLRGNAALIDDAYLFYGARIMGDQKP